MRFLHLLLCAVTIVTAQVAPGASFLDASVSHPYAQSTCYTGRIPVSISAPNTLFNTSQNLSQQEVTEIFQELLQVNTDYVTAHTVGPGTVNGTFSIAAQLCVPQQLSPGGLTVEILSHGLGLDKSYWDTTPNSSYVEAANVAGYATLAYDRLGAGDTDKPDPINTVQFTVHVEVLHGLVQLLRSAAITSSNVSHIVGVGHSVGSFVQIGAAARYPQDFDAVIITGCSDTLQYLSNVGLSTTPSVANSDPSGVYRSLPGGFVIDPSPVGFQQGFFRYPFFQQSVFNAAYNSRSTSGVGEFLTIATTFTQASSYGGAVNIVLGARDFAFCGADCAYPYDRAQALRTTLFPAASAQSTTYLVPDTGHLINNHNNANLAFQSSNNFLSSLGF